MPSFHSLGRAAVLAAIIATPSLAAAFAAGTDSRAVVDMSTCARPQWPADSLQQGQQGTVTLAFLIGADGAVRDALVQGSSGFALLDNAARDGIKGCRFVPAMRDGVAIESWMRMQYVWKIEDDEARNFRRLEAAAQAGDAAAQLRVLFYQLTAGVFHDPDQAIPALRGKAREGDAAAREMLGFMLMQGYLVAPDMVEAAALLRQAAEQGRPRAAFGLAQLLGSGRGVAADPAESERWLRRAADGALVEAQVELGSTLVWRPASVLQGIALLREAAQRNSPQAQAMLGICYETGRGVPRDYGEAAAWYRKAVQVGNRDARRGLARLYGQGLGVERHPDMAIRLLNEADSVPLVP